MDHEEILERFERKGGQQNYICPAHEDIKGSLSIKHVESIGDTGKPGTVMCCHAGCKTEDILDAVGLKLTDLYDEPLDKTKVDFDDDDEDKWKNYLSSYMTKNSGDGTKYKVDKRYDYYDLDGNYVYSNIRFSPKAFRQGVIQDGKIDLRAASKAQGRDEALYVGGPYTEIQDSIKYKLPVCLVEGEKDVDTLYEEYGRPAATFGSASGWNVKKRDWFKGVDLVILPDNDDKGKQAMDVVIRDVMPVVNSLKVIVLSDKEKGDVTDWFNEGHTDEELDALIEAAEDIKVPDAIDLSRFHRMNKDGIPYDVYDELIFQDIIKKHYIKIIGETPFIYEDGAYTPDEHGAKLKGIIKSYMYETVIQAPRIERVYKLFIASEDLRVYEDGYEVGIDGMNRMPPHWICFKNGIYDPLTQKMYSHDPSYLCINMIPHDFDPEADIDYSMIDEWLDYITEAPDEKEMLLQYAGYCLTRDTSQQKMLILLGEGGAGKSVLISLITAMVGYRNSSSVPLDTLAQRFSAYELVGKQLNQCADIKTKMIEDVSLLKQMVGEDSIRAEKKRETGFMFKSYAKLLFSTNEIPSVKDERSNGFYRRLLVHKMMKRPAVVDPDFKNKLKAHIDAFIHRCVDALVRMYKDGNIIESAASLREVETVRNDSDSVAAFIAEKCTIAPGSHELRSTLAREYENYCIEEGRQSLSKTNFFKALRTKGFSESKQSGNMVFNGLVVGELKPWDVGYEFLDENKGDKLTMVSPEA